MALILIAVSFSISIIVDAVGTDIEFMSENSAAFDIRKRGEVGRSCGRFLTGAHTVRGLSAIGVITIDQTVEIIIPVIGAFFFCIFGAFSDAVFAFAIIF